MLLRHGPRRLCAASAAEARRPSRQIRRALRPTAAQHEQQQQQQQPLQEGHQQRQRATAAAAAAPTTAAAAAAAAARAPEPAARTSSFASRTGALLRRLGPSAFLAYISVSNALSVAALCSAWLLFTRNVGATPLAPGRWPAFACFFSAAYAGLHAARPLKLAAGLACAPAAGAALDAVAQLLGGRRGARRAALAALLALQACALLAALGLTVLHAERLAAHAQVARDAAAAAAVV